MHIQYTISQLQLLLLLKHFRVSLYIHLLPGLISAPVSYTHLINNGGILENEVINDDKIIQRYWIDLE